MRLKTIFIIVITILLTIVIMQNNEPVYFKVLFFTTRTSKLLMMAIIAVIGFVIGYLVGRPKRRLISDEYDHGYNEVDPTAGTSTLSDEDRDYISED